MHHKRTLSEWLDYFEHRHQETIQLGLERVRKVATRLDVTSFDAVVITVAGTNGKGSTIAALEAIYHTAGYRVAAYTSPHLVVFNERIRMNQVLVSDEALCAAFEVIHAIPESQDLTYFEMTTLAAFWLFRENAPDVILLEVGMGGRLDATNLIDADLSIISTVDLDHQAWLGETREAIGYEKAGIFRTKKPAIYADTNPPNTVISYAEEHQILLIKLGEKYTFSLVDGEFVVSSHDYVWHLPKPSLSLKAAASAVIAVAQLNERLPVVEQALAAAMKMMSIQGRQQRIDGPVTVVLDVAHNPQSVALLADYMKNYVSTGCIHAVFSGLKDKDLSGLIKPMQPFVTKWYPALLDGGRASNESLLQEAFMMAHATWRPCYPNPRVAYQEAMLAAKPGDCVVVYGSFLTVGAVIQQMELQEE